MAADDKSLQALDALMNEFYSPSTSNERKREIEQLLNDFKGQQDSWKYCLNFFTNTSNEYVLMYCLTVLENVINKKWIGMCGQDKSEIRLRLYGLLLSQYPRVPNFISNKLGKLIVDVGCLDWPHFYPDFFVNILQLSQSNDTAFLGLMLIQTTYEELTSPREDLSMGRKEELRRLLLEQVPPVLNILSGHLESVLEKHNHLVTATPPPSPTHYLTGSPQNLFSTSPLHTGSILSGMLKTSSKRAFEHLPSLDAVSHQLCFLSLRCLSHLLSWIPLSSFVSSPLLSTVFHFASFGCEPDSTETYAEDVNVHCWPVRRNSQLGIQAMGCVNEIMSRTFIPSDFEEFFLQIFEDTFHLLQRLTKDCDYTKVISSNRNRLYDIDEMYIEKFTDFLHLFVGLHLKRFESSIQFPVLEFLALLFKYTFMQPSYDGFYSCLDIWSIFLVYLSSKLGSRSSEISYTISKYREALLALVQEMCRKLQFRYNQSNLEELDDEHLDDDSETEWQHFLRCSLEIISKVAEVLPEEVFNFIYSIFEENLGIYFDLENYVKVSEFGQAHLFITGENECRRLHCSIRDLSSMLQAMGCIVEQMYGNKFAEQKNMAEKFLERLCHMVTYSNKMRFYDMKTAAPLVLRMDFIEVHAQALATLKAFCPWLNQHLRDAKGFTDQRCFNSIEKVITEVTVRNIVCKIPHKVVHSASHLLLSITSSVRPTFLMMMSGFQKMVTAACEGKLQVLSLETQFVVYRSISNVFILPWPSLPDAQQDWSRRSSQHDTFVQALSAPMKSANENPMFAQDKRLHLQAKPIILWTLRVQRDLLDNIADCSMRTKQIFYQSFQPFLPIIQDLFQLYLNYSDPSEIANYTPTDVSENILDLYLCLFSSLRVQIGPLFIQDTIQHFLSVFSRDQLIKIILYDTSGCKVIEKLLQLLQQVVQEPNSSFRAFLPSTISLCMDQIYPMIAEKQSTDVKAAVFDLVHQILLHNWRYFFKTNVVASLGQSGNEIVENEQDFAKIMEAFGQSFFQSDLRIFRQNLNALESLNNKWRLYHKGVFKSMMLNHFLDVLLRTLINKSHNLLQEEIILTIYNMASVHFNNFYSAYLHQFLTKSEGLDANQKLSLLQNFEQETDYPSFTQNIQRFVSDFRYYCVCNSAIPQR